MTAETPSMEAVAASLGALLEESRLDIVTMAINHHMALTQDVKNLAAQIDSLTNGVVTMADGKAEVADGKAEVADAKAEVADAKAEVAVGQAVSRQALRAEIVSCKVKVAARAKTSGSSRHVFLLESAVSAAERILAGDAAHAALGAQLDIFAHVLEAIDGRDPDLLMGEMASLIDACLAAAPRSREYDAARLRAISSAARQTIKTHGRRPSAA